MPYSILLVEDDPLIGQGLELGLETRGFAVNWQCSAGGAIQSLQQSGADVMVLDLGLPDMDGLDLLKRLRQTDVNLPVIILTARDAVKNRIEGLDFGADDYLVKPVSTDELAARIRAAARRNTGRASETIICGELSIDTQTQQVTQGGVGVHLTPSEYQLLLVLATHQCRVVASETLIAHLDTVSRDTSAQSLQVHVHSIRKKLKTDAIQTVRGVGYLLQ